MNAYDRRRADRLHKQREYSKAASIARLSARDYLMRSYEQEFQLVYGRMPVVSYHDKFYHVNSAKVTEATLRRLIRRLQATQHERGISIEQVDAVG